MKHGLSNPVRDGLWVRNRKMIQFVPFKAITHIHHANGRSHLHANGSLLKALRVPIGDLEQKMPGDLFFRTHRNYIVNGAFVDRLDGDISEALIGSDLRIPISRRKRKRFLHFINKTRKPSNAIDHG